MAGPVLGSLFDALCSMRKNPPVAREILVIETGENSAERVVSPAVAAKLVLTLTEMSASSLVFLTPLLGGFGGEKAGESELRYFFEEEFKTVNSNIKNLFDGIRLGSIAPQDAVRFVNETLLLTEQSKERLLQAAFQTEEESERRLEKTINVFGAVYFPQDTRLSLVNSAEAPKMTSGIRPGSYSQAATDRDGVLRRIIPFKQDKANSEHIAWTALKNTRYGTKNLKPFLDETGAIIVEKPKESAEFRSIGLSSFLDYDELERALNRLLAQEMSLAAYSGIDAEKYPPFLFDKALLLQEELLDSKEIKNRWLDARASYYAALSNFFTEETRGNIENAFKKLIDEEKPDEPGKAKLISLRDAQLQKFNIAREVYIELAAIRETLKAALNNAFCILGNVDRKNLDSNPVQNSALLANAILTESVIINAGLRDTVISALLCAFFITVIILKLRVIPSFIIGLIACFCVFGGFCYSFLLSRLWIDPLIPSLCTAQAAFVSVLCALAARWKMARQIKHRFGAVLSAQNLRRLIFANRALPADGNVVLSAIVAVRNQSIFISETTEAPRIAKANIERFRTEVKEIFCASGAVLIGCSGDMVLAAFASPLERLAIWKAKLPPYRETLSGWEGSAVQKAVKLIKTLPKEKIKSGTWHFGIDYGECVFSWSAISGYMAAGRAVSRSKLLAKLCASYKTKALLSAEANEKVEPSITKKALKKRRAIECYEIN
jgi:hypothetical protein